jgi:hypothetical protein
MRIHLCLFAGGLGLLLRAAPVLAQVSDSQRAAARDLFKEGDTLQRSGKFVEALDRFQRAQAVYEAPTNLLRIAECDAALGRLVESAEAFRAVLRAPLPPGSPPAFQAAIDQARAELAQVEPRVPRLTVDVEQPARAAGLRLQIDGQSVASALVGAAMPLDPGPHKIALSAPGYAPAEQQVVLKEQEARTISFSLKPDPSAGTSAAPPAPAAGPGVTPAQAASAAMPPPPPLVEAAEPPAPKGSRASLLLGAHLGWDFPSGKIPVGSSDVEMRQVASSGVALGLDGGLRFARQWYVGLAVEHADLGSGSLGTGISSTVTSASSSTTQLGLVVGLVVNPDRASFYGQLGLASRMYSVSLKGAPTDKSPPTYSSGELSLGAGLWIPAGRSFRVLPLATLGLGTFADPGSSSGSAPGHVFVMLGVAGFYNLEL